MKMKKRLLLPLIALFFVMLSCGIDEEVPAINDPTTTPTIISTTATITTEPTPTNTFIPPPETTIPLTETPSTPTPIIEITKVDKRAEYVIITNHGDQDQDLTDWLLRSERGNQDCYLYGSIGPGESLTIWAMSEDINQEGFNCGFGTNIWNNSKSDPALLFDATNLLVDRYP
jgi:hypothetical protein